MRSIVIFEDGTHDCFYPLSTTRPLWDLRCGIYTFAERARLWAEKTFPGKDFMMYFFTRDCLVPVVHERFPDMRINDMSFIDNDGEIIFINATFFPDRYQSELVVNSVVLSDDTPVMGIIDSGLIDTGLASIQSMIMEADVTFIEEEDLTHAGYIWDLVALNPSMIAMDITGKGLKSSVPPEVAVVGDRSQCFIEDGVRIDPYVVIDVTGGPVYIKSGTVINPFTRIEGPTYIGRNCLLLGAKVREGSSIGDVCRIGGEVEEIIVQGYSNKYHDGFIGHSYVGEWVNMGAMTTCSDLKNNYSSVKVTLPAGKVNTGMNKIGCFIGDCARTSIGTLINTGAVIGTGAMVVHNGTLTPRHIPPFSWYMNGIVADREWLDDFLDTCKRAMSRRDVNFTGSMEKLYRDTYSITRKMRRRDSDADQIS